MRVQGPRRVAALTSVGALLVMIGGWIPSLWTDEAATISAATRPLPDLWRMLAHLDAVHGAYYLVMHGWTALAGTSEVALRAPSALGVGLAAAGVDRIAHQLRRDELGPAAAAATVLLPRGAWLGIEGRPFAAATALGVWATVALLAALARPHGRRWAGYAALAALAVVVNLYVALLVLAHGVAVVLAHRARWRAWLTSAAAAAVVASPVALVAGGQTGQLGAVDPAPLFLLRNVAVNQWFLGETPTLYTHGESRLGLTAVWQPASVLLAVLGLGLVGLAVGAGRRRPGRPVDELLVWTLPWALLPSAALVVWAMLSDTYSPRYAAFTTPAVALLVAAGLHALGRRRLQLTAAVAALVLAAPVLVSQRTVNAKSGADLRQVAQAVGASTRPGDAVYFAPRVPPGPSDVVTLTTRTAEVAYPAPFAGRRDLTLRQTPAQAGDLTGRSLRLDQVGDLGAWPRVAVVRRLDYPAAAAAADDSLLTAAGLHRCGRWAGTLDEVVTFCR